MKRLRTIWILFCLILAVTIVAQEDLTETITTTGGMTVSYPSGYLGEADGELAVAFINLETSAFLVVTLEDGGLDMMGQDASTSQEAQDSFVQLLEFTGGLIDDQPIEEFQINDRPAFLIPFNSGSIGIGYFLTLEMPSGKLGNVMLFGQDEALLSPVTAETVKAIGMSIMLDESLASTTEDDTDETTDISIGDGQTTTETIEDSSNDIPEGAILVSEMPEGMILTGSGLEMSTLEGFNFVIGTEYVEDSVGLISTDFINSIIIFDDALTGFGSLEATIDAIIPTIALLGGHEDFDAETDLATIDNDGLTITYYSSREFAEEEGLPGIYYFIAELMPDSDRMAVVQVTYLGDDAESFEPALLDFVKSIRLTDEERAFMEAPQPIECWDQGISYVNENNTEETVTCPAGCNQDSGTIWGTETYTNDSSICVAAIHMGVIDETGGAVQITHADGQASYTESTLNGITSLSYGEWNASFMVSVPDEQE